MLKWRSYECLENFKQRCFRNNICLHNFKLTYDSKQTNLCEVLPLKRKIKHFNISDKYGIACFPRYKLKYKEHNLFGRFCPEGILLRK